jgi:hypothetical protein
MPARDRFFEELHRAMSRGFTLAAVSVSMSCGPASLQPMDAGSNEDAGSTAQPARGADGGQLAELPADAFVCTADTISATGACCSLLLHCYTPADGTCSTSVTALAEAQFTPPLPPGSGTCMCGTTTGPFAQPNGATTECCFVVGSTGCLGRPLREGQSSIVAAVVARADWA